MFTIDSFACGISPLGESLVILTFEKELQEEVTLKKSMLFSACFQLTLKIFFYQNMILEFHIDRLREH